MHSFPSWEDRDLCVERGDEMFPNNESRESETTIRITAGSLLLVCPLSYAAVGGPIGRISRLI